MASQSDRKTNKKVARDRKAKVTVATEFYQALYNDQDPDHSFQPKNQDWEDNIPSILESYSQDETRFHE